MSSNEEQTAAASPSPSTVKKKPLVILVVGMAGTGKTTLVHRLQHYTHEQGIRSYFINLDPAVHETPYDASIDIRDTVQYKSVMQQYRLGPNGAIMTSLNLYATKFHQVIQILERKTDLDWIVVDTPGQIEVFTWSASGQLITEAFASTFPTVVLFVADSVRCASTQTFMSTMLYSCSIMFKTQLPMLLVLNKSDVVDGSFIVDWMQDSDTLADAVRGQKGYAATLTQSLSLFVQEFYKNLRVAKVSAATGSGMEELREGLALAEATYEQEFLPLVLEKQRRKEQEEQRRVNEAQQLFRLDQQPQPSQ